MQRKRKNMPQLPHPNKVKIKKERFKTSPKSLTPSQKDFNSKKVEAIKENLKKDSSNFKPIWISKDGFIIDGHHRWKASIDILKEIPVIQVQLKRKAALDYFKKMEKNAFDLQDISLDKENKRISTTNAWSNRFPPSALSYLKNYKGDELATYELAKNNKPNLEFQKGSIKEIRKKLKKMDPGKGIAGTVIVSKPIQDSSEQALRNAMKYHTEKKRKKVLGLPIGAKKYVNPYKDKVDGKSKTELLEMLKKGSSSINSEVKKIYSGWGEPGKKVTDKTDFKKDLALDDLDKVEAIMALERRFNISIPDEDADTFKNINDVGKYLTKRVKTAEAKSKSQQRLMGMVHAYQNGELRNFKDLSPSLKKKIKEMANSMSKSETKDYAETKHKGLKEKTAAQHDLIFYSNRSTPQIVTKGAKAKPKKGYGKQTKHRAATTQEEKQISKGKWVRVDAKGNKPSSDNYKKTKYRPQLVKSSSKKTKAALRDGTIWGASGITAGALAGKLSGNKKLILPLAVSQGVLSASAGVMSHLLKPNKTKMVKEAGYFEDVYGFSDKQSLNNYVNTSLDRSNYQSELMQKTRDRAPRKTVSRLMVSDKKLKNKKRAQTATKAGIAAGALATVSGLAGLSVKPKLSPKALKGARAAGVLGTLTLAGSHLLNQKVNKMNVLEKRKIDLPDVDWKKELPKIKKKVNQKYNIGSDHKNFGTLDKYVGVLPTSEYGKNKKNKYTNVYTAEEFDKPYLTKDELKQGYKTIKSMGLDRSSKVLRKALESDKKYFLATGS